MKTNKTNKVNKLNKLNTENKALPDMSIQQILYTDYQKNPLLTFTLKQLIEYNAHLASHKKNRNSTNFNFIMNIPNFKNDIIDITQSLLSIRRILPIISEIITYGGQVTTVIHGNRLRHNGYLASVSKELHQKFLPGWIPGTLSNFKALRKSIRRHPAFILNYVPNFIVFLTPYYTKELQSEVMPLKIPATVIQDMRLQNRNLLYTIPLTLRDPIQDPILQSFLCQLIIKSITIGYYKRTLRFSNKAYKFT